MTMQRKKKAAIFDLDGTLLDSMHVWHEVDEIFLARRNIALPADYAEALAPMGFAAAAVYTKNRFALPETESAIIAEWNALATEAYETRVPLKPYAKEYLVSLQKRHIPISAATASLPQFYMPALKRLGIWSCFSSITELSEVSHGKGSPDIYVRAAEKMGHSPEDCVVFEDIVPGIRGAAAGGFYTVAVYDDAQTANKDLLCAISDRSISSFAEMLADDLF